MAAKRSLGPLWRSQWALAALLFVSVHYNALPWWTIPCAAIAGLAVWLVERAQGPASVLSGPVAARVWLPLLPLAVSSLYLTVLGQRFAAQTGVPAAVSLLSIAGYIAAFVTSAGIASSTDDYRPLFKALAAVGALVCLEAWVENYRKTYGTGWLFAPERFFHRANTAHVEMRLGSGALPWASDLAAWFLALTGATLGLLGVEKRRPARIVCILLVVAFVISILLTGTRTAIIFLVGLFLLNAARRPGFVRWISASLMAGFVLMLGVMATMHRSPLRGDGSMQGRFTMWRLSLRIAQGNPWFGSGPNAFREAWPAYAAQHGYGYIGFVQPHSIFFSMLCSGGLMLVLAALLFAVGLAWNVIALFRTRLPIGTLTLLFGLALGMCVVVAGDVISTAFLNPSMQLLGICLTGLVTGMRCRAAALSLAARAKSGPAPGGAGKFAGDTVSL